MCAITLVRAKDMHTQGPDYQHLYEIAEGQAGYFTTRQARAAGFTAERLSSNVKNGKFLRVVRGVYRLRHFPASPYEQLFVAHLMTGDHSVISHESALALYDLSDVLPDAVHVTIPRTASRRRKRLRLHTNRLSRDETTRYMGLPVTTVARTVADVANNGLDETLVRQAIGEALRRGLVTVEELRHQAEKRGGRARKIILEMLER